MNKSLLIISTLAAGIALAGMSSSANASASASAAQAKMQHLQPAKVKCHTAKRRAAHRQIIFPRYVTHFNRHLTEKDARIITRSHLIMSGQKNLEVGAIKTAKIKGKKRYLINVVTKNHGLVHKLVMNPASGRTHRVPVTS